MEYLREPSSTSADLPRKRFARAYPKLAAVAEQRGATEHRRRLLEGLHGRVVEIGAGHGLTFPRYPVAVLFVLVAPGEALVPVLIVVGLLGLGGLFSVGPLTFRRRSLYVEPAAAPVGAA